MLAERAWSYAMQIRVEANTEPRKKFHLVSRLRKAASYALQLQKLCEVSVYLRLLSIIFYSNLLLNTSFEMVKTVKTKIIIYCTYTFIIYTVVYLYSIKYILTCQSALLFKLGHSSSIFAEIIRVEHREMWRSYNLA